MSDLSFREEKIPYVASHGHFVTPEDSNPDLLFSRLEFFPLDHLTTHK